jgi:protein-disulfide isomerase
MWEARLALPVSEKRDHILGPRDAPVTLVEYGDYECPFCRATHGVVAALIERMGDDLRFVFRHFPITTIHPLAQQAAEAAEAAGVQGKFWPMHDTLYENQPRFDDQHLLAYAKALGLDLGTFARDISQHVHVPKIREDFLSGVHSGVNGTPTFFINGVRHDGPWDLPNLMAAIQMAGARAGV